MVLVDSNKYRPTVNFATASLDTKFYDFYGVGYKHWGTRIAINCTQKTRDRDLKTLPLKVSLNLKFVADFAIVSTGFRRNKKF
jgi:hypothetical protein